MMLCKAPAIFQALRRLLVKTVTNDKCSCQLMPEFSANRKLSRNGLGVPQVDS
jgi:hypothetical protein